MATQVCFETEWHLGNGYKDICFSFFDLNYIEIIGCGIRYVFFFLCGILTTHESHFFIDFPKDHMTLSGIDAEDSRKICEEVWG